MQHCGMVGCPGPAEGGAHAGRGGATPVGVPNMGVRRMYLLGSGPRGRPAVPSGPGHGRGAPRCRTL